LLATPLRDESIFLGKLAAAICFALGASAVSLLLGVVTANVAQRVPVPFVPSLSVVASVLGGAASASLITAAIAICISSRVAVARSVQQIMPLLCMVLIGAVVFVLERMGVTLDWPVILRLEVGLLLIGCLATLVAMRLFRRDRFFEIR
jgi:ABC-type Na+ efflux pump permease subunit